MRTCNCEIQTQVAKTKHTCHRHRLRPIHIHAALWHLHSSGWNTKARKNRAKALHNNTGGGGSAFKYQRLSTPSKVATGAKAQFWEDSNNSGDQVYNNSGASECSSKGGVEYSRPGGSLDRKAAVGTGVTQRSSDISTSEGQWKKHVLIVGVGMLLCNLDRVAMAILAMPLLQEFNISLTAMGVLQSSFLWGYLVAQLPAGILSDRYGGTRTMIWGLTIWSLATCATAFAKFSSKPLLVLTASRVLMGLGSAVALPAVAATVAREVPSDKRARCTTLSYSLFNIGTVMSNLCTPFVSESIGWHWAFILYGLIGLGWVVIAKNLLDRREKDSESEIGSQESSTLNSISLKKLFSGKLFQQLSVLMFTHSTIGVGYFTLQSWIPTFMSNDLGIISLKAVGLWTALVWLATALNTAFLGVLADKLLAYMPFWKVRKLAMNVSTVFPALCFLLISVSQSAAFSVVCILLGLVAWSFDYAGFHPYIVDVCGPYSGTVLSITNSSGIIAGIVGNILTGYLVSCSGNFNLVFRYLAAVNILSCILWNIYMKGDKIDLSE